MIEARSRATSINATPELINDPEAFEKFQKAQGELTGALSRLMVVAEQYPQLRANQAFQDLRVQLEGTENRITVARNRYIKTRCRLQRAGAELPEQPHRDDVRLRGQAELHGAERGPDRGAADGELRQGSFEVTALMASLGAGAFRSAAAQARPTVLGAALRLAGWPACCWLADRRSRRGSCRCRHCPLASSTRRAR